LALAFVLMAAVFALELPYMLWGVRSPGLVLCSPLIGIAVLLILVQQRSDTPAGRQWFRIALTLLAAYMVFAIVVARWVPGGWNSLPEATGSLVTVVITLIGIVVLVAVNAWRTKPPEDPNRALIQLWRARFR
jgi:hypothetical protein